MPATCPVPLIHVMISSQPQYSMCVPVCFVCIAQQNLLSHEAEIFSRPARTWFQTEKEKAAAAAAAAAAAQGKTVLEMDEAGKLRQLEFWVSLLQPLL